jgi:hypothetical protein
MPDSRYAPAREDGTKPYVVTVACGHLGSIVYIEHLFYAESQPVDRTRFAAARRASPEDVTNLKEYR